MGDNRTPLGPMRWISNLSGMKLEGTIVRVSCQNRDCRHWYDPPVSDLQERFGPDADLRNHDLPCEKCGGETLFLASTSLGTPFRPVR
jgi:hypothetical protein